MTVAAAPRLETDRLTLRASRLNDFDAFAAFFTSPRSRFVDGPLSLGQAWDAFAAGLGRWALVGYGAWMIERRADGARVGVVSLNHPVATPERELGWLLWDGFEGQGYALEAAARARTFALEQLGWETFVSNIDRANLRSIRLAEKLGATLDTDAKTPGEPQTLVYRHSRSAA